MERSFRIADHIVRITTTANIDCLQLLPSFQSFVTTAKAEKTSLFSIVIDDDTKPIAKDQRQHIHNYDTGNGIITVDEDANGHYQFIINNINGMPCALLVATKDFSLCRCALNGDYNMRCYGLNSVMMLAFAGAGAARETLLFHASLVRQDGVGYAFTAKSGTGKSTQTANWLRYLPGCDLMNDDNPIVRIINGSVMIYGSPWSGKTPCYRNICAPLGAMTQIERAKTNSVDKLKPLDALLKLLPAISSMKWDKDIYGKQCDTLTKMIGLIDCYTLHCLPDRESAIVCNRIIKKQSCPEDRSPEI